VLPSSSHKDEERPLMLCRTGIIMRLP
jgi:hypothetical protein